MEKLGAERLLFYIKFNDLKKGKHMESELLKTIVNNGAWAVLFVWLLIDTRKESKAREEKLQEIIDKNQEVISDLAESLEVVKTTQKDVEDIKIKLEKEA